MKTLYIPTSTLNFNSIFASESISPVSFYSKRNFGYKTFEKIIELNLFNNSILLYDKLPIFEIDDNDRDNYPMIIKVEVEFDSPPIKTHKDVNVYQYNETIYLNPFTTKVYFSSEMAKKISISGAERSLSTKMVILYEKNGCFDMVNKNANFPTFQLTADFLKNIEDVSDNEIEKFIDIDQRKNKAKGFLYSYLLGANKSLSKELITIKKSAKEIGNVISAIINSPDKIPTKFQKIELLKSAEDFDSAYKKIDKETAEIDAQLRNYGNEISVYVIKKILENKNLIEKIKSLFSTFEIVTNYYSLESAMPKINDKVIQVEKEYFAKKPKFNLSEKVCLANLKLTRLEEEKPDFYMAIINEYLSVDFQNESRLEIATLGIKLLIKMYEEKDIKWNPSSQRDYFNELLANMQGKGTFDVKKNKDVVHQSFALFILHKEKDEIEKLEAALISNTIYEFRFAFGLWGGFNGFANTPKTLTNDLFLSNDLDYVSEIYKYIFKQIHGIELEGELKSKQEKESVTVTLKINEEIPTKFKIEEKKETTTKQQANEIETEYRNKLKKALKNKNSKIDSVIEVLKKNHFFISEKTFEAISKINGIGEVTLNKIKIVLQTENPRISNYSNSILFPNISKYDKSNIQINTLICFRTFGKEIIERLKDNWNYVQKQHDNKNEIINHFINICKKEGDGRSKKRTALFENFTDEIAYNCKIELENML